MSNKNSNNKCLHILIIFLDETSGKEWTEYEIPLPYGKLAGEFLLIELMYI